MKKVMINNKEYELMEDYKDGFEQESVNNLYTDYYDDYDYIVGDWAYSKLRLKGFCDKDNKKSNSINNYSNIQKYIKEQCAYECKYFILRKCINK